MARQFVHANLQYVSVGSPTDITTQMSVGCWVNLASLPAPNFNTNGAFISKGSTAGPADNRNYGVDVRTKSGSQIYIEWAHTIGPNNYYEAFAAVSLSTGTWYHVAVSIDFTTSPYTTIIYLNGASQSFSTAGATSGAPNVPTPQVAALGGTYSISSTGTESMDGLLAEPFVMHGIILPNDVASLAQGARTREVLEKYNVDLYAPLGITADTGTGGHDVDLSGNAHSLSLGVGSGVAVALANNPPIAPFTRSPPRFLDAGAADVLMPQIWM